MKHLTKQQVQEVVMLYETGVVASMSELAKRFEVHHTTVAYHIHKYGVEHNSVSSLIDLDDYDPEIELLRRKQATCIHPSVKCSLCGKFEDNLRTDQAKKARQLGDRIAYLETLLTNAHIPFESGVPLNSPLYTIEQ